MAIYRVKEYFVFADSCLSETKGDIEIVEADSKEEAIEKAFGFFETSEIKGFREFLNMDKFKSWWRTIVKYTGEDAVDGDRIIYDIEFYRDNPEMNVI